METEKLVERIRKLFELAADSKGNNAAEAAVAMKKAQRLMAEHDIAMAQVEDYDKKDGHGWNFTRAEAASVGREMPPWKRTLLSVVCKVTNTEGAIKTVKGKRKMAVFFGDAVDVTAAIAIFTLLWRQIDVNAKLGHRQGIHDPSYRMGFVNELWERAEELTAEEVSDAETYALVLYDKKNWLATEMGHVTLGKGRRSRGSKVTDMGSYMKGQQDGRNADMGVHKKLD